MIDLENKYIEFIKNTINNVLTDVEIYIFGSRVQGLAKKYSDVDIALKSPQKIAFSDILKIKALFENSIFPYKVDIVNLDSLKPEFLNVIEKDLVKI